MNIDFALFGARLKANWQAGITVALISLPLSIALSIASGAGPMPGIITGFWATLVASLFGSSNYNIIGVAGALTTVLFAAAAYDMDGAGGPWVLPFLAMASGGVILLVWAFKFDRYLRYIPTSVMYGFATGVALLIASNQLFDALGLSNVKRHGHFIPDIQELGRHASDVSFIAFGVFAFFLAFLLLWKRYIKQVPGIIPASILGTLLGLAIEYVPGMALPLVQLVDKYGDPVTGAIPVSLMMIPDFGNIGVLFLNPGHLGWFIQTAVVIALIAVLETLITARLGDKIAGDRSDSGKEVRGLGLANIASGVFGGLPATGVFIRTGANIKAGATHKMSQGVAAVVTGVLAFGFLPFFKYVPMAVIAAILFNTAIGLIELHHFKRYLKEERKSFIVGVAVAVATVIVDAGFGVLVGTVLALLFFIDRITKGKFEAVFNANKTIVAKSHGVFSIPEHQIDNVVYGISGFLGYIDASTHTEHIEKLADTQSVRTIIIRMRNLYFIDLDGIDALSDAVEYARSRGKNVLLSSVNDTIREQLVTKKVFRDLADGGKFYPKTEEALSAAGSTGFTTLVEGKNE